MGTFLDLQKRSIISDLIKMNGESKKNLKVCSILFWSILLSVVFMEGYFLIGVLLLSILVGYIILIELIKARKSRTSKKLINFRENIRKEAQKTRVKEMYEQGLAQLKNRNYKEARKSFKTVQDDSYGILIDFRRDIPIKLKLTENRLNLDKITKIDSIIKDGDKKQSIFNKKIEFSNLYNQYGKRNGKKAIWKRQETKAFKIWNDAKKKINEYDYEYPLVDYRYAFNLTNDLYDSIEKDLIQNKILDKINDTCIAEIKVIRDNVKELRKRNIFGEAIDKLTIALQLTDKIIDLELKNKSVNEINEDIDQTYILEINSMITKAEKLKKEKLCNEVTVILNEALLKSIKLKNSHNKDQKIQEIYKYFDSTYNDMIIEKIERGNELKKTTNFNESMNAYNEAYKIAQKFYSSHKRKNNSKMINGLKKSTKIAKIKNAILQLGTQFARLQIIEIAEECGEDEDLIVTTVKDMIEGEEIYAKYFERSRAVAFNLQANIDDIDKLMAIYKQWEKEEKDKV